MSIYLLKALCLQLFFPTLVGATTILSVRTPTEIFIGADSKVTLVAQDGSVTYEERCKIVQVGKIFFTAAGPYGRPITPLEDPRSGLDIRASLVEAQASGGTIEQIIARFSQLYTVAIARSLQDVLKSSPKQFERVIGIPVSVYFFAFYADTPLSLHKQFIPRRPSTTGTNIQILDYDCPPKCADEPYHLAGTGYGDIFKSFSRDVLKTRSAIEVIRETIESSIKDDPAQRSGFPIDILHLKKDSANWVQKKKQCPEIQPY